MRAAAAILFLLSAVASAQPPDAPWRTLSTPHYRIHYPAPTEAWARHVAARVEAVRERVGAEVGFLPEGTVEVVIMDPRATGNGFAYPILGRPRIVLWASPPEPRSTIGHFRDWGELVLVHEDAHLVHLMRPSRRPLERLLAKAVPVGPIPLKAPRWVIEGYATLIEGRVTGSGRPFSALRAAVLRRWAQTGRLPSYGALAAGGDSWLGPSMAYLAGSAYLEWLEERSGPEALGALWARLSARTPRSFEEAFRGVFAAPPGELYGRFTAELTWRAMELERRRGIADPAAGSAPGEASSGAGDPSGGELWMRLEGATGAPALAPDGTRLAVVVDPVDRPPRLLVLSTAEPDEDGSDDGAGRRRRKSRRAREDPEDVPAVAGSPPSRAPLAVLPTIDGRAPSAPRFFADGTLLVVRSLPDRRGVLHPDLFRWDPGSGRLERLTRNADLRQADPAADGSWAVAVRHRHGLSQLVRVDLVPPRRGAEVALTEAVAGITWAQPRLAPDGRRLAALRHRDGRWRPVVMELAGGEIVAEAVLPVPPGALVADPAWSADGDRLYAVVATEGAIEVRELALPGAAPPSAALPGAALPDGRVLTRTPGGAFAPAASADGRLFFLALEPHGFDLRVLAPAAAAPVAPAPGDTATDLDGLVPAVAPLPDGSTGPSPASPGPGGAPVAAPFRLAPLGADRRYRPRLALQPLIGLERSPSAEALEAVVAAGDVLGRVALLAAGVASRHGERSGVAVSAAYRGLPVELGGRLFDLERRPSRSPHAVAGRGERLDRRISGAELTASWERTFGSARLRLAGGALAGEAEAPTAGAEGLRIGSLAAGYSRFHGRGRWQLGYRLDGRWDRGSTGGDGWRRFNAAAAARLGFDRATLTISGRRGRIDGARRPGDLLRLGGLDGTLAPAAERAGRLPAPALAEGALLGEELESQSLTLGLGGLVVSGGLGAWGRRLPALVYQRHRVVRAASAFPASGEWLALAGLEWTFARSPTPLLGLPAFELRAGAARLLDPPFSGRDRWWLSLAWRP